MDNNDINNNNNNNEIEDTAETELKFPNSTDLFSDDKKEDDDLLLAVDFTQSNPNYDRLCQSLTVRARKLLETGPSELGAFQNSKTILNFLHKLRRILAITNIPTIFFGMVIDSGIVPLILSILEKPGTLPAIQLECTWILTNIASGETAHVEYLTHHGMIEACGKMLKSTDTSILVQSLWGIGNIIGDSFGPRNLILTDFPYIFNDILRLCEEPYKCAIRVKAIWALSNFYRNQPPAPLHLASVGLPMMIKLLKTITSIESLKDVSWGLANFTEALNNVTLSQFHRLDLPRLVLHYLRIPKGSPKYNASIQVAMLRILGNIIAYDEDILMLGGKEMVETITNLLIAPTSSDNVKKEISWIISNLMTGNSDQILKLIHFNVFKILTKVLRSTLNLVIIQEIMWSVINSTLSIHLLPILVKEFIQLNLIEEIISVLTYQNISLVTATTEALLYLFRLDNQLVHEVSITPFEIEFSALNKPLIDIPIFIPDDDDDINNDIKNGDEKMSDINDNNNNNNNHDNNGDNNNKIEKEKEITEKISNENGIKSNLETTTTNEFSQSTLSSRENKTFSLTSPLLEPSPAPPSLPFNITPTSFSFCSPGLNNNNENNINNINNDNNDNNNGDNNKDDNKELMEKEQNGNEEKNFNDENESDNKIKDIKENKGNDKEKNKNENEMEIENEKENHLNNISNEEKEIKNDDNNNNEQNNEKDSKNSQLNSSEVISNDNNNDNNNNNNANNISENNNNNDNNNKEEEKSEKKVEEEEISSIFGVREIAKSNYFIRYFLTRKKNFEIFNEFARSSHLPLRTAAENILSFLETVFPSVHIWNDPKKYDPGFTFGEF